MKFKLLKGVLILFSIVFTLCIFNFNIYAQTNEKVYEISFAYTASPGADQDLSVQEFAKIVNKKSNGRIVVKTFPAGQLGNSSALIDLLQLGSVELILMSNKIVNNISEEYRLLAGYFLFDTQDQLRNFWKSSYGQEAWQEVLDKKQIRLLGFANRGLRHITSNRPIYSVEDMKGLKIRVPEQPIYIDCMKAMGASPVSMGINEVFTSLQQKIIEAQENPIDYAWAQSFFEVQDYLILTGHRKQLIFFCVNEEFFSKLPDDLKVILKDSVTEAAEYLDQIVETKENKLLNEVKERGITVIEPDVKSFQEAVQPVLLEYSKYAKEGMYDFIKSLK